MVRGTAIVETPIRLALIILAALLIRRALVIDPDSLPLSDAVLDYTET